MGNLLDGRTERRGDCLIWTGSVTVPDPDGYGRVWVDGAHKLAHIYAWEQVHGPVPEGVEVDHICHVRRCCEPKHLRLSTHGENGANRRGSYGRSGFRNVYPHRQKFRVMIRKDGQLLKFGSFDTAEEAAAVAAQKRAELFGEFAGRG